MANVSIFSNTTGINVGTEASTSNALPVIKRASQAVTELSSEVFSKNLKEQLVAVRDAIPASVESHGLKIENVKVKLIVDAKGGVHLFGELSAGISASIEVEFKPL